MPPWNDLFEMKAIRFVHWANSSCTLVCSMFPSLLCLGECRLSLCRRTRPVIGLHWVHCWPR